MIDTILLDSGPLGLVTNPKSNPENLECKAWLESRLNDGCRAIIPAIIDYEVRRELIRANKTAGLRRLDEFCEALDFLSISDEVLRQAAELWARARGAGRQTAANDVLDADMILVAQLLSLTSEFAIIATSNVGHLAYLRLQSCGEMLFEPPTPFSSSLLYFAQLSSEYANQPR